MAVQNEGHTADADKLGREPQSVETVMEESRAAMQPRRDERKNNDNNNAGDDAVAEDQRDGVESG